ncbi:MAG: archaeal proteasome endopeptidase complex subunit beta [Candidatus Thermoplasmatota archaeon]|nr:archaeal proteasome endopeptidase complex subunit beta [Candidatus Thermoplasmatota archaeon]
MYPAEFENLKRGTTTLALVCKDGVVIGAEKRATMGTHIAHKVTKKIFKIDDALSITTAGLVGDAQLLARWLSAEVALYKMRRGVAITVKGASTLMANILSSSRYFPFWVQLLVCGIDNEGNHIYSLDPAGGNIEDKYVATGSGLPYVYGVLEDYYKEDINTNEGVDLALRALTAAMKRDSASGDAVDIVTITKKGYKEITEEEIKKRKEKLELA